MSAGILPHVTYCGASRSLPFHLAGPGHSIPLFRCLRHFGTTGGSGSASPGTFAARQWWKVSGSGVEVELKLSVRAQLEEPEDLRGLSFPPSCFSRAWAASAAASGRYVSEFLGSA